MRTFVYILYIWMPVLVAVGSVVGSGIISWRHRGVIHFCLSLIVTGLVVGALFYFYRMFYLDERAAGVVVIFGREHFNFMPHFAIYGAFSIFASQGFYVLSNKTDAT